jgi:hypothetical protein
METDRYGIATNALHLIFPGSKVDGPPFDRDGTSLRQQFTKVIDDPLDRFLSLPSTRIDSLIKISSSVEKRHSDQRDF